MVKKSFEKKQRFLHIPVKSKAAEQAYYVDVEADGVVKNELLIAVCRPGEDYDFYVALDMNRYQAEQITLICQDENAAEDLFDAIVVGGAMGEEKELYPGLYEEEIRQQIHFSPARGWMNDPNGLFYKDGVYHMYFQHNSFANHHFCTNVSWGHATSTDGVHFTEHGDAIMPRNSRLHIASGSAMVDQYNISGLGKGTVLAAYTDLITLQYHGRPKVCGGGGQNVLYSLDDGMTYQYFENNPVISVPDHEYWRDPKILQVDEKTLCIAVYETFEGKDCVSFYKSTDCVNWEFCSRDMDLYECPDLFVLQAEETGEWLWVLYGASGMYRVGSFEDFKFCSNGSTGYIDYGDCVYAGQTFNNYDDPQKRLYIAWMRDHERPWDYKEDELYKEMGFSQSMGLLTELSLHKTPEGYQLFRKPVKALEELRMEQYEAELSGEVKIPVPGEVVFELDGSKDAEVRMGKAGFSYDAKTHQITTSSEKKYTLGHAEKLSLRILIDKRSAEMYVNDEIAMSFFVKAEEEALTVTAEGSVKATVYALKSIWK